MSIDVYLNKKYDRVKYNCAHFVSEVWFDLTGTDLNPALTGVWKGLGKGRAVLSEMRVFKRIKSPESPCVVMLNAPRTDPHVGIFLRGKILHITETGVHFDHPEVVSHGFTSMRFYKCL